MATASPANACKAAPRVYSIPSRTPQVAWKIMFMAPMPASNASAEFPLPHSGLQTEDQFPIKFETCQNRRHVLVIMRGIATSRVLPQVMATQSKHKRKNEKKQYEHKEKDCDKMKKYYEDKYDNCEEYEDDDDNDEREDCSGGAVVGNGDGRGMMTKSKCSYV